MTIEPSLNISRSTVPIPVHDLKIKLTDIVLLNLYNVSCYKAFD